MRILVICLISLFDMSFQKEKVLFSLYQIPVVIAVVGQSIPSAVIELNAIYDVN